MKMENQSPIRLCICGALGRMGQVLTSLVLQDERFALAAGIVETQEETGAAYPAPLFLNPGDLPEGLDVLVDFSHPSALPGLLRAAQERGFALVLAATGYDAQDLATIRQAAGRLAIFRTANMSYGVTVLQDLIERAAVALGEGFDPEIVEKHHRRKIDAPSGTAYMLAETLQAAYEPTPMEIMLDRSPRRLPRPAREIGVVAVRGGSVTGTHEVGFYGDDESLTLTHNAESRALFARGALRAAAFIAGRGPGLYDMRQLMRAGDQAPRLSIRRQMAVLSLRGLHDVPEEIAALYDALSGVTLDMVCQSSLQAGRIDFCCALDDADRNAAMEAMSGYAGVEGRGPLVKLTLGSPDLGGAPGGLSRLAQGLAARAVQPLMLTTGSDQLSFLVPPHAEKAAVNALREAFGI